MKILVLGATGLLGKAVFTYLGKHQTNTVFGSYRSDQNLNYFKKEEITNLVQVDNITNEFELRKILEKTTPDIVINCLSLKNITKQSDLEIISLYGLFPKKLYFYARKAGFRVIHISTDGVFSGKKGDYSEHDIPDAEDIYGMSKFLGELDVEGSITIRTSIIGHDEINKNGLLEWFLRQKECALYSNVIFSGLPVNELARVIHNEILNRPELHGIFHISSEPISKYDLLSLVSRIYGVEVNIIKDDLIVSDRSLVSDKFYKETGYCAPDWKTLIKEMKENSQYG